MEGWKCDPIECKKLERITIILKWGWWNCNKFTWNKQKLINLLGILLFLLVI